MIEALAAKDEKTPEGADENHDHDHEDNEEHEKDEHIWLSLKNAEICLQKITAELCSIDTVNKTVYEKNSEEYSQKLNELDVSFKKAVSEAEFKILVFCDRFPFRYLADDYGIDYYAAFSGCSAETEASFETIVFLANKIDELNLKTICIIESGDGRIAETVKNTTAGKNQEIVKFDSMQSINRNDILSWISLILLAKLDQQEYMDKLLQIIGRIDNSAQNIENATYIFPYLTLVQNAKIVEQLTLFLADEKIIDQGDDILQRYKGLSSLAANVLYTMIEAFPTFSRYEFNEQERRKCLDWMTQNKIYKFREIDYWNNDPIIKRMRYMIFEY